MPLAHSADPPEVSIHSAAYILPPPIITAEARLVESGVVVYDSRGRVVDGLTSTDFALVDNGKPQPITTFSELRNSAASATSAASTHVAASAVESTLIETATPRSIALYFDDMHLSRNVRNLPDFTSWPRKS